METTTEIERVLNALKARRSEHEATVAKIVQVRREHALAASQGDKPAITALQKAEADEAAANRELQNVEFAIQESESRLTEARKRETTQADERNRDAFLNAGDQLLDADLRVKDAARALRSALDGRQLVLSELLAAAPGHITRTNIAVLDDGTALAEALADEIGAHLGPLAPNYLVAGKFSAWPESDYVLLGRTPPPRELTPIERQLKREMEKPHRPFDRGGAAPGPKRSAGYW